MHKKSGSWCKEVSHRVVDSWVGIGRTQPVEEDHHSTAYAPQTSHTSMSITRSQGWEQEGLPLIKFWFVASGRITNKEVNIISDNELWCQKHHSEGGPGCSGIWWLWLVCDERALQKAISFFERDRLMRCKVERGKMPSLLQNLTERSSPIGVLQDGLLQRDLRHYCCPSLSCLCLPTKISPSSIKPSSRSPH